MNQKLFYIIKESLNFLNFLELALKNSAVVVPLLVKNQALILTRGSIQYRSETKG